MLENVLGLDLGPIGDEIHLALALLFLESERDTSDGANLDSLHQVGGEAANFVSQSFGLNLSNIINDAFVGAEVDSQFSVVLLDDGPGGTLDSLGSYTTLRNATE